MSQRGIIIIFLTLLTDRKLEHYQYVKCPLWVINIPLTDENDKNQP